MAIAAVGVLLVTGGGGCAKRGKSQASLAQAPPSPGVAGVAPARSVGALAPPLVPQSGGTGTPGNRPQASKTPPTSKPGGGSGGGGGTAPSSPPAQGPPPQATPPPVHNDFSIVTTGKCYWLINYDAGNNDLMVAAEFTISYRGDQSTATTVPISITTNPSDGYHSDGPVPLATEIEETGGQMYQVSPFAGQQITLTGTLNVSDDIASDTAASITVSMPTVAQIQSVGLAPSTYHQVSCHT